jgi:hypothetical protein
VCDPTVLAAGSDFALGATGFGGLLGGLTAFGLVVTLGLACTVLPALGLITAPGAMPPKPAVRPAPVAMGPLPIARPFCAQLTAVSKPSNIPHTSIFFMLFLRVFPFWGHMANVTQGAGGGAFKPLTTVRT